VRRFHLDDLRNGTMPWDALVPTTPGIDPWCTRRAWQLSVHEAFGTRTLSSTEADEPSSASAFMQRPPSPNSGLFVATSDWSMALRNQQFDSTAALVPLDAVWGFASPFVLTRADANPFQIQRCADEIGEVLLQEPDWELAFLAGLAPGSPLDDALIRTLGRRVRLVGGEPTIRCVASLEGGTEGFLSRRSRPFRRNLRQATARALNAGLSIETVDISRLSGVAIVARLVAIEAQSWKGLEDSGITSPDMAQLYTSLIDHLGAHVSTTGIRLSIAQIDGVDVGFILGGVIDQRYRGLQLSFTQSVRALSVGNLLQWHEVQRLCLEGVHTYDLGMDMDYKRFWSESIFITRPIVAVRQ
jgi:hypothetical protein